MINTKEEAMKAYDELQAYFLSSHDNGDILLDMKTIRLFVTATKGLLRTVERTEQMKKYADKHENQPFSEGEK